MKSIYFVVSCVVFGMFGCGPEKGSSPSHLSYIQWSDSSLRSSTVADARKDEIKVCLSGSVSAENYDRSQAWSLRAILTWFRTLKVLDDAVTANVTYTCSDYDLYFQLRDGNGTSYASPSWINVYMSRPYGTWTHELGHALAALGDTYQGGSAGNCRSGHPESLMCWGAYGPRRNPEEFSTLWPDDIAGVQGNYRRLFGNDLTPPEWSAAIDLEAPLDVESPWPGANPEIRYYDDELKVVAKTAADPDDVISIDL